MDDRLRPKRDAEVLTDALTRRVLTRASELDELRRAGATVAELRAAATEAGISAEAFDAALAEVRDAQSTQVSTEVVGARRRTRLKAAAAVVALLIGLGVFTVGRTVVPAPVPTLEQTLSLRCLTPAQVGELVRPWVDPGTTSISFSDRTPGEFTIRATPADIEKVKAVLNQPGTCARQ